MKKIFILLISFLFISCATTKNFITNELEYEEKNNYLKYIRTSEYIEATYEPNVELILFDTFGTPFYVTGLFIRETGRVVVYSVANISMGYVYGVLEDGPFMNGLWLPDIEQTKEELNELNKKFNESDYIKYKKYTKRWAKTTLNVRRLVEEVDWNGDVERLISETNFTLVYVNSVQDTVARVSKKSSLVGETIGSYTTKITAFPTYSIGWLVGLSTKK